jgi:hypothetical protein
MARDTQHGSGRRGQKLGSSERDYIDVLQLTQVSSHHRPPQLFKDAKRHASFVQAD